MPDGNLLGASDQGPTSPCIEGNPRGVAIRPPNYQQFGIRRDMILKTEAADDVLAAAMSQLGKPFDSSGMWSFLADAATTTPLERDWRNVDAWWCSEHKTWSLEQGKFFRRPLAVPKTRVSPADLLLILMMDERWVNYDTFDQPISGLKLDPGET